MSTFEGKKEAKLPLPGPFSKHYTMNVPNGTNKWLCAYSHPCSNNLPKHFFCSFLFCLIILFNQKCRICGTRAVGKWEKVIMCSGNTAMGWEQVSSQRIVWQMQKTGHIINLINGHLSKKTFIRLL